MPRLATTVAAATVLIVVLNLIPSGRYTTFIQYKDSNAAEFQNELRTTAGNATALDLFSGLNVSILSLNTSTVSNTTRWQSSAEPAINMTTDAKRPIDPTSRSPIAPLSKHDTTLLSFFPPTTTNLSQFLKETRQHLMGSPTTTAWSNVSTYAFGPRHLISGYRNQIMSLAMLMMKSNQEGHQQFLLDSLYHKDTYGTDKFVPFEVYFDVEHWNSYYHEKEYRVNETASGHHPISLPRLVYHNATIHHQWNSTTNSYQEAVWNGSQTPTHPYGYLNPSTRLQMTYQRYAKGKTKYVQQQHTQHNTSSSDTTLFGRSKRNPAEILMLQGALRPHPTLQGFLESLLEQMKQRANRTTHSHANDKWSYMTLHARVEPDMQRHPVCKDKKVLHLRKIIQMIEAKFPVPPVSIVFMPINRQYLEKEGIPPVNYTNKQSDSINWIAEDNLNELNRITTEGMWNGTVPVVEFGANALTGTVYEHRPSTAGAILNFFLTLQPQCSIFVGTEVSSFSHDVLASRFYRGYRGSSSNSSVTTSARQYRNYKYLPEGLVDWISADMVDSPGFLC